MVLLKNERGERKKIVCILAKLVEERREKKIYLFVLFGSFLIFQKFIPLFYSTHIERYRVGVRSLTYYLQKKKNLYIYIYNNR